MRVLVCCEESQRVMMAFRSRGHDAFSNDLIECSGGFPEYHLIGDCFEVIQFFKPDLLVAHPPCTYLSRVTAPLIFDSSHNIKDLNRYHLCLESAFFFKKFFIMQELYGFKMAVENPIPLRIAKLPPWSQIVNPSDFGSIYSKRTCLWLVGLPLLVPVLYGNSVCYNPLSWVYSGSSSASRRSKTDPFLADAMGYFWG